MVETTDLIFAIAKPLLLWINDGAMAVFFFFVGLELKRELLDGRLSSLRRTSLPAFAALGGRLAPDALFDDLGAIIVIALFYTAGLSLLSLAVAAVGVLAMSGLAVRLGLT